MELTYVTIVVLASMIFVLSGMVGYLYWQQTKMLQHIQSLALALASYSESVQPQPVSEPESEPDEVDDRVSVELPVTTVDGPPPAAEEDDVDDLHLKTAPELRELLSKKGIPYGKRDSKNTLLELLKTTA
jgi:hypothetical protein